MTHNYFYLLAFTPWIFDLRAGKVFVYVLGFQPATLTIALASHLPRVVRGPDPRFDYKFPRFGLF